MLLALPSGCIPLCPVEGHTGLSPAVTLPRQARSRQMGPDPFSPLACPPPTLTLLDGAYSEQFKGKYLIES